MKKNLFLLLFFGGILPSLFGQKNPTRILGTVSIDATSSMDATEVTIQEWIYFVINNDFNEELFPDPNSVSNSTKLLFDDLKKRGGFEFFKIVNNIGVQKENYGSVGFVTTKQIKRLVETDTNYFSILIPIVGISYAQAVRFCEWREALVNTNRAVKIRITLPSIEVYRKVNANKDSLCAPKLNCDGCKLYQLNYFHPKCTSSEKDKGAKTQGQGLLKADVYWPSPLSLYNIQGNAAEMTSTIGVAVGGSFRHFAKDSYNDQIQEYKKQEDWLGFRCLVTLQ
jgi:formylglycine-generating enzyme required for sulfatase activity